MIDFTLSEQQNGVRTAARGFAQNALSTAPAVYAKHAEQHRRFQATQPLYREAVMAGLVKAQVPTSMGGAGGSFGDAAILVEELYAVETSVSLTILATGLGLSPLIAAGSDEQKEEFLEPFINGEGEPLASLVHSEPTGTANWLEKRGKGLQTTARKEGEEWVISGEKARTFFPSSRTYYILDSVSLRPEGPNLYRPYRCGRPIVPAGISGEPPFSALFVGTLQI